MVRIAVLSLTLSLVGASTIVAAEADKRYPEPIGLDVPHISGDSDVQYDYPIVYVRVPRKGDDVVSKWPEIAHPVTMDPRAAAPPLLRPRLAPG